MSLISWFAFCPDQETSWEGCNMHAHVHMVCIGCADNSIFSCWGPNHRFLASFSDCWPWKQYIYHWYRYRHHQKVKDETSQVNDFSASPQQAALQEMAILLCSTFFPWQHMLSIPSFKLHCAGGAYHNRQQYHDSGEVNPPKLKRQDLGLP